ncbi:type VI secretion system membrane subunit TssM [Pseudoalteromonas denitrificans]|uniref:Type VI secretion system protein ImpL n=1 Tax=Pseudoalteromonas denitrificans DSM 6059 TaxID=1123010 RepID=A0A1I1NJI2_9GAMM|nr:type VI secretion system membrane subunit TssM [Pseudoalteromonas denitrificans]SFC95638.1 type VI secretion system protein ImpL [Pseudoalteromonas denitrificans DSM 6059]
MQSRVNTSGMVHFLFGLMSSRATGQVIGLLAVLTIVWFAGQLIGLDSSQKKFIAMGVVFSGFLLFIFIRWLWTKRSGDKLVSELASHNGGSASEVAEIQEKMQEALSSLKASHLGAGYRGNTALYALPWYMIIGPSATGKSTIFANSGLHFPYANANDMHIQGFGGTRNCDWWFSDQAVLIDTAGRYTTEASENEEWLSFLSLLKKYRPKLPINGVMVAISISDILTSDSEAICQHVKLIRERIEELIAKLGVIFPVYITFTKTDLISGFEPFFNDLSDEERQQVWGAYLLDESEDQSIDSAQLFEQRMQELYQRLSDQRLSKIARERNLHRKQLIFDFPNQFKAASHKLTEFINLLFKQNPYQEVPWFAGVYFTSGTQEGTPIERIMAGVREEFNSVSIEQKQETITKSYFIKSLFNDVLFKLQDLTRGNRKQRLVQRWFKGISISAGLASIAGIFALLMTSYTSNQILFSQGDNLVNKLVENQVAGVSYEQKVSDLVQLHEHFEKLTAYEESLPWYFIFGIYEGDETLNVIESMLITSLRSVFTKPFEAQVSEKLQTLSVKWQATNEIESKNKLRQEYYMLLKLHLMLAKNPEQIEGEFVNSILLNFWTQKLQVDVKDPELSQYITSLKSIVSFYTSRFGEQLNIPGKIDFWQQNPELIEIARNDLATQPEPEPLYQQIMTSKAAKKKSLKLKSLLTAKNRKIMKASETVPYVYTKQGWREFVFPEIQRISALASSGDWVMGSENDKGESKVDQNKAIALARSIRSLYFKEYAEHWFNFILSIEVADFNHLNEASLSLAKLSSVQGPFAQLMKGINVNLQLADKPQYSNANVSDSVSKLVADNTQGLALSTLNIKKVPELESRFADLRRFTQVPVQGDSEISDFLKQYLSSLSAFHSDLKSIAGNSDANSKAMDFAQSLLVGDDSNSALQASWIVVESQIRALEPETKKALEGLLKSPLKAGVKSIMTVAKEQLNEDWSNQVYAFYNTGIRGKYPFSMSGPDAAVSDVSEFLNNQSGLLWVFVDEQLKPFMKLKKSKWIERQWNGIGIGFKPDVLKGINRAYRVSKSLFSRGSDTAGFEFQMMPVPQRGIRETYLGFSDQGYRYRNEPEEWRKFSWPGQSNTEKANLYAVNSSGERLSQEKNGPWALLKILNTAKFNWVKGTQYSATWDLAAQNKDGSSKKPVGVKFKLKSSRNNGIFNRYTLTSFSLPEHLFDTGQVSVSTLTKEKL